MKVDFVDDLVKYYPRVQMWISINNYDLWSCMDEKEGFIEKNK